jgi:hypothetical protein
MAGTTQATIAVATPKFAKRQARALIGWLPEDEGALWLAGRDRQVAAADAALHDRAREARAAAAARPALPSQQGIMSPLPPEMAAHAAAFQAHPLGSRIIAEAGSPAMIDLTRLRAIQPLVHIEDARKRFDGIDLADVAALATVTIPIPPADPPALQPIFDPTKQAHIIASPNPNLRIMGVMAGAPVEVVPGIQLNAFGFIVGIGPSFLKVGEIDGRYLLLDGYHRAYGLLAAGVKQAPALVRNYGQLREANIAVGMLSPDVVLGDHAPVLPDYLDDRVSADTLAPLVTKLVIIQALEVTPLG